MFELIEDKSGECIELMVTFIHPFGFVKMREEIVEGYLTIDEIAAVITLLDLIVRDIGLGDFADDCFQDVIECDQA